MALELPNFALLAPQIVIALAALVLMTAGAFARERWRQWNYVVAQLAVIVATLLTVFTSGDPRVQTTFGGIFLVDWITLVVQLFIYLSVFAALIYGRFYLIERGLERAEYYALVLLSLLGMQILTVANHLLLFYLGLELMSLALYALVAFDRNHALRAEAGMKYFVLGALASGLILYGLSLIYGATATLSLPEISSVAALRPGDERVFGFGLAFLVAGIAFKFGAVPFHMWVADVYHGAPTPVTLLLASAPKLAAFALAFRLLVFGFFEYAHYWQPMLMILAVASIVLGNLAAIAQKNLKRMLAYSGISHVGFILLGLAVGVVEGNHQLALNAYSATLFYAIVYAVMSMASFGLILLMARAGFEAEWLDDVKGLNQKSPWFAAMLLITMFSLAGVPFFVGFFAKLAVLQAVVAAGYLWVAVVAVVMSLIGAFYYLRVVKLAYFDEPTERQPLIASSETRVLLSGNALALALFGLMPQGLMSLAAYAMIASL
ncbi:NADH-quinone oxidoreductase subunit NuoN [Hydrogenophilus thermoluteolus]|uniref:NADH-quinone oxidoreductase subunit N n=1 Tax=Hydrogenophilus thermoluteolus TaxID=297 RepID=A0A2Z6DYP9_HYDTE|nr:NADH-quinone oxidoreductase subunit NuoN [Hydrogenophilus thermoluteolus]BBD77432.1 NADH-quinone oxidoreductase subunit N [Hydrogenophilus thermoluteolus]GLW59666.1 NADH-quinone oxidoreductase subunit N [Hydrogenophilus thermoluteolus]